MNWIVNSGVFLIVLAYVFFQMQRLVAQATHLHTKIYIYLLTVLHFAGAAAFYFSIDRADMNIDAVRYYQGAVETSNWFSLATIGHGIVSFLIFPFTSIGVQMATLFLVFATISLKGFYIYLDVIGVAKLQQKNYWLLLLFLMPSAHFWTGFIGKDAITFLLLAVVLKAVKLKSWNWQLLLVLLAVFVIRPHVFFVLSLALLIVIFMDAAIKKAVKKKLALGLGIISLLLLPIGLLFFMKISDLSIEALQVSITQFLEFTKDMGATAINLTETSLLERMGYVLCMPLPFLYPLSNSMLWASAIENCCFLSILLISLWHFIKLPAKTIFTTMDIRFALIASVGLWLLFSAYVYNLGLANRMRIVFFPYLVYFLIQTIPSKKHEKKTN